MAKKWGGSPSSVMAKVLDGNLKVNEFKFSLYNYANFQTNILGEYVNSFIS